MSPATTFAPSRTAAMVAEYRARASQKNTGGGGAGLCNDPWAGALVGDFGTTIVEEFDLLVPFMELLVAVRTAFFDGQVRYWTAGDDAVHLRGLQKRVQPVDQVVVVGAGLDSRGARLSRAGLAFYEVDHPRSLRYKMERVREIQGYPGEATSYVACDLEQDELIAPLSMAGFQPQQPALFLCEGLVPYLSETAVRRMLSGIAATCHESSIVVLDHVVPRPAGEAILSPQGRLILERLESLGEPLRFGRGEVIPLLHHAGFQYTQSVCLDDVREMLTGEPDPANALRFQQVTIASRRSLTGR